MAGKIGLTLGKFAPFHRGHQLVIETALAEMDQVMVLIYHAPETTTIPLAVRAQWIRDLYPAVEVIEAPDGPTQVGYTPEIMRVNEAYILRRVGDRGITHFYSSEPYGAHVSVALGAINRMVDSGRVQVPVSGTHIRANPFLHRAYIHPRVYRELITHVVFLGAPSTGKTTLAQALAEKYQTQWMPEYGREYWEKHQVNRRLSPEQLLEIAEGHLRREDERLNLANQYLFTDTNAITTFMFARYYHGQALPALAARAKQAETRYDLSFLCGTDIPYEATWDRSGDVNRMVFQEMIEQDLLSRQIPFIRLCGDLESRMRVVAAVLAGFEKFQPRPAVAGG